MLDKQQQLYQRICDYELDDPSHEFGFLAHLMRANGWGRPMMLGLIATVGIYGYQRQKWLPASKKREAEGPPGFRRCGAISIR
jgi:hypothetical protein